MRPNGSEFIFTWTQVPAARRISPPGLTENVMAMINKGPHHMEETVLTHSEEPDAWTQHIPHKSQKDVR